MLYSQRLVGQQVLRLIHPDLKEICVRCTVEKFLIAGVELAFFQIDLPAKLFRVPLLRIVGQHFQPQLAKFKIKPVPIGNLSLHLLRLNSPGNCDHKLPEKSILILIGK